MKRLVISLAVLMPFTRMIVLSGVMITLFGFILPPAMADTSKNITDRPAIKRVKKFDAGFSKKGKKTLQNVKKLNAGLSAKEKKALQKVPRLSRAQASERIREVTSIPAVTNTARLRYSHWEMKTDHGVYYTTSSEADLDREVLLGAQILKSPADNKYLRTTHKQYPRTCGPASLAIVLEQLGLADPNHAGSFPVNRDVDNIERTSQINVGYKGSMEHLMWLGYHRKRLGLDMGEWNDGNNEFMDRGGLVNLDNSGRTRSFLEVAGDMQYLGFTNIPKWLWHGAPVGANGFPYMGLTGIMNYILSGEDDGPWRDARYLGLAGASDSEVVAIRRIIKGFIDHKISLVAGVDGGGHFNAIIGYRGDVSPVDADFWVYTADPLDGWGRSRDRQPGTWRRIKVTAENLGVGGGGLMAIILWNHHAEGTHAISARTGRPVSRFRPGRWAAEIDRANGNNWLTGAGHQPPARDVLFDSMGITAERMP